MIRLSPHIREQAEATLYLLVHLPRHDATETRLQLVEIVHQVIVMRDELIAANRRGESCDGALQGTNALLSSIFGVEFPAGGLRWKRLNEAQNALKALLSPAERPPPGGARARPV
jgi:hypothetical protein